MKQNKKYTLVETFSGKEVATSDNLDDLRDEITQKLSDYYSIMSNEGWTASASLLYKDKPKHKTGI